MANVVDNTILPEISNEEILHQLSNWNWLNPVGSEEVKYKKTVMSKKQRAHILGGLKHWKKVAQANRKGEDYSCREYLYRLDHATDE